MTNVSAEDLKARINACIARLDDAIAAAQDGTVASMKDMETEVDSLYRAIMAAPIATGHEVQGAVAIMIARLDTLEGALTVLRDEAASEL
jgi:hypothetical protein